MKRRTALVIAMGIVVTVAGSGVIMANKDDSVVQDKSPQATHEVSQSKPDAPIVEDTTPAEEQNTPDTPIQQPAQQPTPPTPTEDPLCSVDDQERVRVAKITLSSIETQRRDARKVLIDNAVANGTSPDLQKLEDFIDRLYPVHKDLKANLEKVISSTGC